ncbi:hypothetical protein ACFWMG_15480 [Streptomyces sp. NPDC127074]|uniref:hypothetical protein n=1 Tax=Streptomyces sp. NPDC127074 TaxID=3347130 RepID=UPI00365CB384
MNAREKIANLLWWSVPSADDTEAKALTEQMLDAHRAEVLAEGLSDTEKAMLRFAVELADDTVASRGDEFDSDDTDALDTLRRMASETVGEAS